MLKSGRDLDALVAEKVMGWRLLGNGTAYKDETIVPIDYVLKNYSTDIAAAWGVVEYLDRATVITRLNSEWCSVELGPRRLEPGDPVEKYGNMGPTAKANTAPLAICLAALKAVGVEVEG